jgi:DNA polymerase/3'-5' exonuclease PolX
LLDGRFKAKSYVRAASSLRRLVRPLGEFVAKGVLRTIPGVGEAIARRIEALQRGESDPSLERLRTKLPAELPSLLGIFGLKPATILKLNRLLGVESLDDVGAACREGKVATTKGLGAALERKILPGFAIMSEGEGRLRMNQAHEQTIAELESSRPKETGRTASLLCWPIMCSASVTLRANKVVAPRGANVLARSRLIMGSSSTKRTLRPENGERCHRHCLDAGCRR